MQTVAILPVKSFDVAKQRLRDELPAPSRSALAEAMFSDVLLALREASALESIVVVSTDAQAQLIAAEQGAITLDDDERGHNAAAGLGIRTALQLNAERALLVPGDCPLLDPAEVDALLALPGPSRSAVIVPDRHGTGTNALLLAPPDALAPAFGPDSCERHVTIATANGAHAEVREVSSLALDVDTPDDLRTFEATLRAVPDVASHTRRALAQLIRSRW